MNRAPAAIKRYLLLILLGLFSWAQLSSAGHAADHPFHKASVYCDTLLAAHAQSAHTSSAANLPIDFNAVGFWQPPTAIFAVYFFTWSLFSPRAPPL
jgi:hypothetical protein